MVSNHLIIWCFDITGSVDTVSLARSFLEKPGMVPVYDVRQLNANRSCVPSLTTSGRLIYSPKKQKGFLVSCVKTSEAKEAAKSNGESSCFETGQHGYLSEIVTFTWAQLKNHYS